MANNKGVTKALENPNPNPCKDVKVHLSICLELQRFLDRILLIILATESARPNCSLAIEALCSLHLNLNKAKSIIKHCSECSKLYLISAIIHELKDTEFSLENAEFEARKAILALYEKDINDDSSTSNSSMENAKLEAIQIATSRLEINSPLSLMVEKSSLRKQLDQVKNETNQKEKELLQYLLYLLIRYGKFIHQIGTNSLDHDS
ncbi:hypothetical protein PIB30_008618 [Stylosanthes scabra]|uniref:Uncharacterized protein n=1 Tax=Stylosanthes scabra TaxID=79078 RepID=A0ABU6R699_9FABA|nr:hypothetical protein [Stylosanthes scabra]